MCDFFVLLNVPPKSPGIKKTICRLHGSCCIRFLKTGHRVFPVKSKVSDPSCNAFHFILCFPIKAWPVWKDDWWIRMMHFHKSGNDSPFLFLHAEPCLWKHLKGGNSESSINILISVQHRLAADWSEAKIYSFILSYLYCQKIWGNQIFLRHISEGVVALGKTEV